MDRRHFLTAFGLAATGPVAAAVNLQAAAQAAVFPVNGEPLGLLDSGGLPGADGLLSLGYLPGSGESLVAARAAATPEAAEISIYRMVSAPLRTIEALAVTVHFPVAGPVSHVPYFAWQYAGGLGDTPRQSSPVSFSVALPQGAVMSLDYGVRVPGQAQNQGGSLTYRLGGTGLGPGVYVLAGPSAATGRTPVWADLVGAGDPGKLARRDGAPIDFDYLVIDVAPA